MTRKLSKPDQAASTGYEYPKVKQTKLPKSLGACVDKYYELRQARLAAKRHMEALEEEEKRVYNHILDNIPKGDSGAVGKNYKAIRTEDTKYSIADDAEFYAYVKRTGAFDLLNRAINQRAVKERLEDTKFVKKFPKGVPGTKGYKVLGLSVTKV
jgi:hypothetical protein